MARGANIRHRPATMRAESIRAILADLKSQTRRAVDPDPMSLPAAHSWEFQPTGWVTRDQRPAPAIEVLDRWENTIFLYGCPYGAPGDLLWVKEAYAFGRGYDGLKPSEVPKGVKVAYAADVQSDGGGLPSWAGEKRNPRFMPKWVARVWLEITGIGAERLQAITLDDALAEGVDANVELGQPDATAGTVGEVVLQRFARAWDELNAKRGFPWKSDPLVWVIDFRRTNP